MLPEMASLCSSALSQLPAPSRPPFPNARTPVLTLGVIRLSPIALPIVPNFRLKNARSLHQCQRSVSISASKSSNGNSDERSAPESSQGPPVLTILAAFLVLFILCWGISSVVMWFFGIVVKLISSN